MIRNASVTAWLSRGRRLDHAWFLKSQRGGVITARSPPAGYQSLTHDDHTDLVGAVVGAINLYAGTCAPTGRYVFESLVAT